MSTATLSQFARIEGFARVPSKKKKRSGTKPAANIVAEALREPAYCKHVAAPQPPIIMFGCPKRTLDKALRMANEARDARGHKLRKDAHIMAGCVVSYPVSVAEVSRSPRSWATFSRWLKKVLSWVFPYFGPSNVGAIVLHMDESHPHLHIFITPPTAGVEPSPLRRAGKEALRQAGKKNPKRHEIERRAYRDAAIAFQQSLYDSVSRFFNHTLSQKGRRRLTRREWFFPWNVEARRRTTLLNAASRFSGALPAPSRSPFRAPSTRPISLIPPSSRMQSGTATRAHRRPGSGPKMASGVGGFPQALRRPVRLPSTESAIAPSPAKAAHSSRQTERIERPLHVTPRPTKPWQGNRAAANQAHIRAREALRGQGLATVLSTTDSDAAPSYPSADDPALR